MHHKSPVKHVVKTHKRESKTVRQYVRGKGLKASEPKTRSGMSAIAPIDSALRGNWKVYHSAPGHFKPILQLLSPDKEIMINVNWVDGGEYGVDISTSWGNSAGFLRIKASSEADFIKAVTAKDYLAGVVKTVRSAYPQNEWNLARYKDWAKERPSNTPSALAHALGIAKKAKKALAEEKAASEKSRLEYAKRKQQEKELAVKTGQREGFDSAAPFGRVVRIEIDVDPDAIDKGWQTEIRRYNKRYTGKWDNFVGMMEDATIEDMHDSIAEEPESFYGDTPRNFAIDGISMKVTDKKTGVVLYDE